MANRTHGMSDTRTHKSWDSAISRCHWSGDPSFQKYGAIGIAVCDRWRHSFANFYADMGERPEGTTLDRIDNSKGYEPGNCRWATPVEQSRNRKSTKFVVVRGERMMFMEACERFGINASAARARLTNGFTEDEAFLRPLFKGGVLKEWRAACEAQ